MSYSRKALFSSLPVLLVVATACSGPGKSATGTPDDKKPPPFPTSFDALPALEAPPPPDPDKPGLAYLQTVQKQLAEPWGTFLENCRLRLPPEHPLNKSTLAVLVHLTIDGQGALHSTVIEKASGNAEFDEVALEVIREAAPFAEPPVPFTSDDDLVHVRWLLARDRRQAGVATAELYRFEWPVDRAVPKFLAKNDITTAAQRLLRVVDQKNPTTGHMQLAASIAEGAIRAALASRDPAIQLVAAQAAAKVRMISAAEGLRAILDRSKDMTVRAQAIRTMGAIGDRGAASLLLSTLENAKGSGVGGQLDAGISAALALSDLGSAEVARSTVHSWFQAADKESLWAALVVMSRFPVPAALPELLAMSGDTSQSRKVRMAACMAVGAATDANNVSANMKGLRKRFEDKDAAVRAACVNAVALAAENGVHSRFTYWNIIEIMKKDRDERVREAAVRAATALEPGLFHSELYLLRKETSVPVLSALATGLGRVPDPTAFQKLRSLADHVNPLVHRPAIIALLGHPDARAQAVVRSYLDHDDMAIRLSAIRALRDQPTLAGMLGDESPEVRRAAFETLLGIVGKRAMAVRMLRGLVESKPQSRMRIYYAASWLAGRS